MKLEQIVALIAGLICIVIVLDAVLDWKIIPYARSSAGRWSRPIRVAIGIIGLSVAIWRLT